MAKNHNEYNTSGQPHMLYIDPASMPLKDALPSADGTRPRAVENNLGKMQYNDTTIENPDNGEEHTAAQLQYSKYMDTGLTNVENPESSTYSAEGTP